MSSSSEGSAETVRKQMPVFDIASSSRDNTPCNDRYYKFNSGRTAIRHSKGVAGGSIVVRRIESFSILKAELTYCQLIIQSLQA